MYPATKPIRYAAQMAKCYDYSEVFVDEVDPGHSDTCRQDLLCRMQLQYFQRLVFLLSGQRLHLGNRYPLRRQPNAASASRSLSDVASISASGANSGISASAAAKSGLKTASAAGNYTATAASAGLKTASATQQQQAPPPVSLPWPPALPPATRKRPAPKAVTTTPSRLTKSALQRVTTDTPAIPVAAIKLVPTMATILPFLPEKPVQLLPPLRFDLLHSQVFCPFKIKVDEGPESSGRFNTRF